MLGLVQNLRHRFHDARFTKAGPACDILAGDGTHVGFIDALTFKDGRLRLQGWVQGARRVTLHMGGARRSVSPSLKRSDVEERRGIERQVGFDLNLAITADHFIAARTATLSFDVGETGKAIPSLVVDFGVNRKTGLRADLSFAHATIKVLPACVRWATSRNAQARARVLDGLGLNATGVSSDINPQIFARPEAPLHDPQQHKTTIILPIYNALDLLAECVSRVLDHTDVPFHLILIEDASPDKNVRMFLRKWVAYHCAQIAVDLIENDVNLGFIGSVNKGLNIALGQRLSHGSGTVRDGPIVILNSDAFVPRNWASRLIAPLLADHQLASTTPMSNDAEILSIPVQCRPDDLEPGMADRLDACAADLNPEAARAEVPTGVGFCMALSRQWLHRCPQLDADFGRGYGEEVDWCQRTRALGAHHVALGNLFVEHRGGASFGQANKLTTVAKNNAIISARYPAYDSDVQIFMRTDPLLSARLTLAIAWAGMAAKTAVPIYLAHSLGGGADHYVRTRITADLNKTGVAIVLRVGGTRAWRIEVHAPQGRIVGDTDETDLMIQLLAPLTSRHIIYSCGVGAPDPIMLPSVLHNLHTPGRDGLSVLVHDYFMISPSYTLLGADGAYRGPRLNGSADPSHTVQSPTRGPLDTRDWQAEWHRLLERADQIEVFSKSSADILNSVWPDMSGKLRLTPHRLPCEVVPVPRPDDTSVLGVLGGINFAKGAGVVQHLAQDNPDLRVVVIGNIDPAYPMPRNVTVHGTYRPEDISDLAIRYGVSNWLIPSIWPETFSYTTHEVLATGRPVLAFDLGAQGDAVAAASHGVVLPFDMTAQVSMRSLAQIVRDHLN